MITSELRGAFSVMSSEVEDNVTNDAPIFDMVDAIDDRRGHAGIVGRRGVAYSGGLMQRVRVR